jgi:hypothetical protein
MTLNTHLSAVESHRARLREGLDELLGAALGPQPPLARFARLRILVEALPLTSTEFGLAVNHLAKAQHCLEPASRPPPGLSYACCAEAWSTVGTSEQALAT